MVLDYATIYMIFWSRNLFLSIFKFILTKLFGKAIITKYIEWSCCEKLTIFEMWALEEEHAKTSVPETGVYGMDN